MLLYIYILILEERRGERERERERERKKTKGWDPPENKLILGCGSLVYASRENRNKLSPRDQEEPLGEKPEPRSLEKSTTFPLFPFDFPLLEIP